MTIAFAVIGGTGLTEIDGLEVIHREVVHTPYGEPSGPITHGMIAGKRVVFLARHGYASNIPPHRVNYRANLWALKSLGVEKVVAVAVLVVQFQPWIRQRLHRCGRLHRPMFEGVTHEQ